LLSRAYVLLLKKKTSSGDSKKYTFQPPPDKNEAKNKDKKIIFLKNFKKKYFLNLVK
jgi:hypothetical protein